MENVIPRLTADDEIFARTLAEVEETLAKAKAELTDTLEQNEALAKQNGLDGTVELHYSRKPYRWEVDLSSPTAIRYLELIEQLDKNLDLVELLWLMSVLKCRQHINGQIRLRKVVYSASNRIRQIQQTIENTLRKKQQAAKQGGKKIVSEKKHKPQEKGAKDKSQEEAPRMEEVAPQRVTMDDVIAAGDVEDRVRDTADAESVAS